MLKQYFSLGNVKKKSDLAELLFKHFCTVNFFIISIFISSIPEVYYLHAWCKSFYFFAPPSPAPSHDFLGEQVRNNYRHYFLSSKALKVLYDIVTWAVTQLAVSYTVAPFVMLAVEPTISLYK